MPAIATDSMAKSASASGMDPGPSALTQPNILLGISLGCASLTAVIASVIVWRYLKRRCKGRDEMSAPGLVLDGNITEETEPKCTLNLDLEKGSPDLPHITVIPPELLFTPAIEEIFVSDSDSEPNVSIVAENDAEIDEWDFKCRGQPLDIADDEGCDGPYPSQERASAEAIQDALTLASPPTKVTFEEEEVDRLANERTLRSLWTIIEEGGEEGNEHSEGHADENLDMCMYESTDIAQEDAIEKANGECLENEDPTIAILNDDAKSTSASIDEYPYPTKDLTLCDSLQTKIMRIDIKNDDLLLIENDSEVEAAIGSSTEEEEVMLQTNSSKVGSAVESITPDSPFSEVAVEVIRNYHFSETASIQDFAKIEDEKGEGLHTKLMKDDSTMALNAARLDIPTSSRSQALQAGVIHESDTPPLHYRPSASLDLVLSEGGMPTVASVKGKDDGTQMSDFLSNEKCLEKSCRNGVIKADALFLEGEKVVCQSVSSPIPDHSGTSQLSAEIDQKRDACARDIEAREETDALIATSNEVFFNEIVSPDSLSTDSDSTTLQSTKISLPPTTSAPASSIISEPIKLDSTLPVDGLSHNGQCSPPWWEVLEKIKQDPLGCNGVEMFREWAIKNGIASEHVKHRSKSKPLAKHTKPATPPVRVVVRKASIPVPKDREVIKRDFEKMFREWWAAGNETILGPAEDRSYMRPDQVDDTMTKHAQSLSSNQDQCSSIYYAQDNVIGAVANEKMNHSSTISSSPGTLRNLLCSSATPSKEFGMTKAPLEGDRCRENQLDEGTNHEPENSFSSRVSAHILRRSSISPIKRIHEAPITPRNLTRTKNGLSPEARTLAQKVQQNMVSSPGSLRRATLPSEAASTPISMGPKTTGSSLRDSSISPNRSRTAAINSPSKLPVNGAKSRLPTMNYGKSARTPPSPTTDHSSTATTAKVDSSSRSPQRRSLASPAKPIWNSSARRSSGSSVHMERTQRKMGSNTTIAPANRAQTKRRDTLPPPKTVVKGDTSTNKENTKPSQRISSTAVVNGNSLRRTISSESSLAGRNGSASCVGIKGSSIWVRA